MANNSESDWIYIAKTVSPLYHFKLSFLHGHCSAMCLASENVRVARTDSPNA